MGSDVRGAQVLQYPADGRLRGQDSVRRQYQDLQVGGGQVGGVLPYHCQAATSDQHPGRGQGQDLGQVIAHAPPVPWVGDVPDNVGQGLA